MDAPLTSVARLVRPLNLIAIGFAAWVGARLGGAALGGGALAVTVLVPVFIGAFGYARNDAVDIAADRFNRPDRPVPAADLSPRAAHIVAWCALSAAAVLVAASRHDASSLAIAACAALALWLYSPWLKDRGWLGPAAIALLTVLAVVWGSVGGASPERAFLPAALAGAVQFARECVKGLEDAPGDRAAGRRTWAVVSGAAPITLAARLAILAGLLLLPLPVTAGHLSVTYLLIVFPTSGLLMLWTLSVLGRDAAHYGRLSAALKIALLCGLLALAAGA